MLEMLSDAARWEEFYRQRVEAGHLPRREARDLRRFIDERGYLAPSAAMLAGEPMPLPVARTINKRRTGKKRTVFTFPRAYNYALKLLAWGLRRYDGAFPSNLYSFRAGVSVRHALAALLGIPGLDGMYAYKADVHDYFNSVDVEKLLPVLRQVLADDPALYRSIEGMLRCPEALRDGRPQVMRKGIMAGTPISPFLANVCLMDMDARFEAMGVPYARYSDDIILFAPTREALEARAALVRRMLDERGLAINPDKEAWSEPGGSWTFLGFRRSPGALDVAEASVDKLMGKMRRKARALMRWQRQRGKLPEQAARAFIRHFNRRLYDNPRKGELTWARWYFPAITTDAGLRRLDRYMQDQIRFIVAGHHGKKRYNLRYATLKAWGYRPLAAEYWRMKRGAGQP